MQDGIYRQRAYDTICAEQPQFYNGKVVGAQQYRDTCRLQQNLRQLNSWYIFHWRPNGGACVIMPRPDNEEANNQRRQKRKDKKKRQQERKKDQTHRKDKDGKGGGGSASTSRKSIKT